MLSILYNILRLKRMIQKLGLAKTDVFGVPVSETFVI
jgi:hypothetical protein